MSVKLSVAHTQQNCWALRMGALLITTDSSYTSSDYLTFPERSPTNHPASTEDQILKSPCSGPDSSRVRLYVVLIRSKFRMCRTFQAKVSESQHFARAVEAIDCGSDSRQVERTDSWVKTVAPEPIGRLRLIVRKVVPAGRRPRE